MLDKKRIRPLLAAIVCFLFLTQCERSSLYFYSADALSFLGLNAIFSSALINVEAGRINYLDSGTYNFGTVTVGTSSPAVVFTIRNAGTDYLVLSRSPVVTVGGDNQADFMASDPGAVTLAPGGSTTFTVTFKPTAEGLRSGTISIRADDSSRVLYTINVTGTGTATAVPSIYVRIGGDYYASGSGYEFGSVTFGASKTVAFTIENAGATDLNLSAVTVSGVNASDFTLSGPGASVIAAGASAVMAVTFSPISIGECEAMITVANDDPDESAYTIGLTGTGSGTLEPDINIHSGGTYIISGNIYGFGNVVIGAPSTVTFTIENGGTGTLTVSGHTLSDATLSYSVSGLGATTIGAGSSTTFTVTFNPTVEGTLTAVLTISSDDSDEGSYVINLNGYGVGNPEINVKVGGADCPSGTGSYDFGTVNTTLPQTAAFTVQNTGTGALTISVPTTSTPEFTVTDPGYYIIAAGASMTFTVTFSPGGDGNFSDTLTITSTDADESSYTISLSGTGSTTTVPDINLKVGLTDYSSGSGYGFGYVTVGSSATATFTIQNVGVADLTISTVPTLAGSTTFTVSDPGCTTIPAGGGATFTVTFTPTAETDDTALFTIVSDDPDLYEKTYTINLTGSGRLAPYPDINLRISDVDYPSGGAYSFGTVSLTDGDGSGQVEFRIQNLGPMVLSLTGSPAVSITGPHAADFTVVTAPSTPIAASGGSTIFTVAFYPSATGTRVAHLTIASNDPDEAPYAIDLHGTGSATAVPNIKVQYSGIIPSGGTYDFGEKPVDLNNPTVAFYIFNTGDATLNLTDIGTSEYVVASGSQAADIFNLIQPGSASIAPGGNVAFSFIMNPLATGTRMVPVTIESNDPDEPVYTINMKATGVMPVMVVHGGGLDTTSVYDPSTNSFSAGPTLISGTVAHGGHSFDAPSGSSYYGNRVVIHGGFPGSETDDTSLYAPNLGWGVPGTFSMGPLTASPVGRGAHSFLSSSGHVMLITGGGTGSVYANTFIDSFALHGDSLDYATGEGSLALPMTTGNLFILSGNNEVTGTIYNQSTDAFDTTSVTIPGASVRDGANAFSITGGNYSGYMLLMPVGTTNGDETYLYNPGGPSFAVYSQVLSDITTGAGGHNIPITNGANAGRVLIVHGGTLGNTTTSVFDPTANSGNGSITAGPTFTVAVGIGAFSFAITGGPYKGMYMIVHGRGDNIATIFNPDTLTFVGTVNLSGSAGAGAHCFPAK